MNTPQNPSESAFQIGKIVISIIPTIRTFSYLFVIPGSPLIRTFSYFFVYEWATNPASVHTCVCVCVCVTPQGQEQY